MPQKRYDSPKRKIWLLSLTKTIRALWAVGTPCVIVALLGLTSQSCDDQQPERSELDKLPPLTATGKNTFGCLVNGKAWVTSSSSDAVGIYQIGVLQIHAEVNDDRDQNITLAVLSSVFEGKSYDLSDDPQYEAKFGSNLPNKFCIYEDDKTVSGKLTISRFNQSSLIVAGTFEFITSTDGCDTIKVTDGRFDLIYVN